MSLSPQRDHRFYIHLWIRCLSIDTQRNTRTHISIFKHAASAWRHDTTTLEPKYIQGHSGIASQQMRSSLFHLLAPFNPFTFNLPSFIPNHSYNLKLQLSTCKFLFKYEPSIMYERLCICFCTRLEGPGHLDSLKVISASLRAES